MGKCYYVIRDFEDDVWDVLCTSFEEALGHVLTKINEMNKNFRKDTPWKPHDIEYTPGLMEDDFSIEKSREPHGVRVANFSDYRNQFFIKEVRLSS